MTDTAQLADVVLPATDVPRAPRAAPRLRHDAHVRHARRSRRRAGEARSNNQLFGALLERLRARARRRRDDRRRARRRDVRRQRARRRARARSSPSDGVATPAGRRRADPVRRRVPGDARRQDPPRARRRSIARRSAASTSTSPIPATRRVPARADLAGARDADQLDVRPAPHRARRRSSCRPPTRAARGIATGDRVRVWNALGEVRCAREGLDGRARRRVRAAEGPVAQAHRERLHRERADPGDASPISAGRPRTTTRACRSSEMWEPERRRRR